MKRLILAAAVAAMFGAWNVQADEAIAYTVIEGEDIQTVAGRYEVTVEDIRITNGLESEEITVGTVIYIPPSTRGAITTRTPAPTSLRRGTISMRSPSGSGPRS